MQENYNYLSEEDYRKKLEECSAEEISESTIHCIFEGINRGYESDVKAFLEQLDENQEKKIRAILPNVKEFQSNEKGVSFSVLCLILHSFLKNKMSDKTGDYVIRTMPHLYEKKNYKECNDYFRKYVISVLMVMDNIKFFNYGEPEQLSKFRDMCEEISKQLVNEKLSDLEMANIASLTRWLSDGKRVDENIIAPQEIKNEKLEVIETSKEKSINEQDEGDIKKTKKVTKKKSISDQLSNLLNGVKKLEIDNVSLRKKLERGEEERVKREEKIKEILEQKNELEQYIEAIKKELEYCKRDYTTLENSKRELEMLLKEREEIISIYGKDKSNSQMEMLNGISENLKAEYLDFLESVDIEMSVEMGEVYKEKIIEIFRILEKNGVRVED